jgi:hypothetical protein
MNWISVKDRLPGKGPVLVYQPYNGIRKVSLQPYHSSVWETKGETGATITHWMPLPNPPQEATDA